MSTVLSKHAALLALASMAMADKDEIEYRRHIEKVTPPKGSRAERRADVKAARKAAKKGRKK